MEVSDFTGRLSMSIKKGKKDVVKKTAMLFTFVIIASCNINSNKKTQYDTPSNGTIYISVDESFEPVINEQIQVYEASHQKAHIIASYKSEADCFRDLQKDSTRLIIVSRGLSAEEIKFYREKIYQPPLFDIVAYDAVCAIINIHEKDSVYTLQQLAKYMDGEDSSKTIVVDGRNATSTVKLLQDSLLHGKSFSNNVVAANGSKAVVEYISQHENAIGFAGASWVGDYYNPEQKAYFNKIKFALLECKNCDKGVYAKPSQSTIYYNQYPLVRPLYFILKENATGLGTGFTNFLSYERGQLVFKSSNLVAAKMNFRVRKTMIDPK